MNNSVILLGTYGSDQHHALAAWTSTYLELGIEMPENIEMRVPALVNHILEHHPRMRTLPELLQYLGNDKHVSPFRFSGLHFAMTTEVATHIQFLKHSVALRADNGESARYKELKEDKYYIPQDWLESDNETVQKWVNALKVHTEVGNSLYHQALKELSPIIGRTRAKETARFFKGYNSQINTQKLFSFASFAEIYYKRNLASPSQREIGWIVEEMRDQIQATGLFDDSLKAFKMWK